MQPSVTLIIPVHNASSLVERFTGMCAAQTLDAVEIIFVDDCSTDDSAQKINGFIASYSGPKRFVLTFTERNSGPGAARNLGLSKASGEYVCFVDCDDCIKPEYCEKLYSAAKWYDADVVSCNASCNGKVLSSPDFCGDLQPRDRKRILRTFVTYIWTYAFRREFITSCGIRFPEERSSEDTCFLACAWLAAFSAAHIDEALYQYNLNPGSVSNRKDRKRGLSRIASLKRFGKFAAGAPEYRRYLPETLLIMLKKGYFPSLLDFLKGL